MSRVAREYLSRSPTTTRTALFRLWQSLIHGGRAVTDLWYDVTGQGSDVVLFHSGLTDSRSWESILPALARRHRVVRYDARAFGRSPDPTSEYELIDDALGVMEAAAVGPAHLVGNSLGATAARAIAMLHPDRVRSLTLVAPGFHIDDPPEDAVRRVKEWREARSRGE